MLLERLSVGNLFSYMAKTKLEKKEAVKLYSEALASADALYFVKPAGLTSNESTKLKLTLNKLKAKYVVVKTPYLKELLMIHTQILMHLSFLKMESMA